jgi:hypothetical protein
MTVTEVLTTRQQRKSMARTLANNAYPIKAWRYVLLRAAAALAGATLVFFGIGIAKADPFCGYLGRGAHWDGMCYCELNGKQYYADPGLPHIPDPRGTVPCLPMTNPG